MIIINLLFLIIIFLIITLLEDLFGGGGGLSPGPCIFYALSIPTELISRGHFVGGSYNKG